MWYPSYLLLSISGITYSGISGRGNFFSHLLLIWSTLKPASLPDFIEQVFIETHFVSGIIIGTGDINGVQTNKVFAFMELIVRGETHLKGNPTNKYKIIIKIHATIKRLSRREKVSLNK